MIEAGATAREIRQRKPFRTPQEEGIVALLRTADHARRRLTELIDPFGITLQQYNVLRILRGAGEEGLPTLEIASRMIEQAPGITRLLDRLEAKGLVRRKRCPEDRRQVLCWITDSGKDLLQRLDLPLIEKDREILAPLRPAELSTFIRLMDKVRAAHSKERSSKPR
jgi:DNA-binding MarR family transcriptional regulator